MPETQKIDAYSVQVLYDAATVMRHHWPDDEDGIVEALRRAHHWLGESAQTGVRGPKPRLRD